MNLELIREFETEAGGIAGRLYIDGEFFGYTLENKEYNIPEGFFNLYDRFSPKLNNFKLHIEVPGRNYIMFHGGNTPKDSLGCVLVARNRYENGNIQGDLSKELYERTKSAVEAGKAFLSVRKKINWPLVITVVLLAAAIIKK